MYFIYKKNIKKSGLIDDLSIKNYSKNSSPLIDKYKDKKNKLYEVLREY